MGFLQGITQQAAPSYRKRRFLAFVIDMAIVLLIWFVSYQLLGRPDFISVKAALDALNALPVGARTAQDTALVFAEFDKAYLFGLVLAFAYDALTTLALNGRTLGKLAIGLQIAPLNPARNRFLQLALLPVRSLVKMASLYIFQGIPFLVCALTTLTSANRSGFDFFVKTCVAEKPRAARQ